MARIFARGPDVFIANQSGGFRETGLIFPHLYFILQISDFGIK